MSGRPGPPSGRGAQGSRLSGGPRAGRETDARLKAGGEPTLEESIQSRVPSGQEDCYPIQALSAGHLDYGSTVCERQQRAARPQAAKASDSAFTSWR